jgi:hypothetical protein
VIGALSPGVLLSRYYPNARGSGAPRTKTALFLRGGSITIRTVLGTFGLCAPLFPWRQTETKPRLTTVRRGFALP